MAEKTEIAWANSTFNPWIGCQKVSEGCDNCLDPDTLVLYRDWTWRTLGKVSVGDELLGFPDLDKLLMRRLEVSIVEKVWTVQERGLEIRTPEHKIICSYDHPFVARSAASWTWTKPRHFSLLRTYLRTLPVNPPKPFTHEYMKGYLSGPTQEDGFKIEKFSKSCSTAQLTGGAMERGRFYGAVRPAVEYKVDSCLQTGIPSNEEQIIGMTDVGKTNLIDIQTSTGTFFANGFAVHNCYAETLSNFHKWTQWGPEGERVRTKPAYWRKPLVWNRDAGAAGVAPRVFCASLADVFDNQAPEGARDDLWELIRKTPNLEWQILTKRPQNIEEMLPPGWPDQFQNVWLGVSAENQQEYDRRWPLLAESGAPVKFISYEPALGPISIRQTEAANHGQPDWLIWGGESGPGARKLEPNWIRDIIQECEQIGVKVFGKQWGSYQSNPLVAEMEMSVKQAMKLDPKTNGKGGAMLDGKLPAREFPRHRLV